MTIIAGFKCYEGIVICADTQETFEHAKRYTPKLVFEPAEHEDGSTDDLAAAFCGAGDGPYVDKLIASAWEAAQTATNLDEACADIETSIKGTYKEFGRIYQTGYCPTADLIYGVKMYGDTKLFSAHGPVVNEKKSYDSTGVGHYIADFLAARMHQTHLNLQQCVTLAAYILFQAKEHVEGCGGDTHIAVLRDEGVSGRVGWKEVDAMTEILKTSDRETGHILLQLGNLDLTEQQFKDQSSLTLDILCAVREQRRKEMKESGRLSDMLGGGADVERDSLGLRVPPDSSNA